MRAVAPFPRGAEGGHAARRRRRFRGRASRGGLRYCLQVGVRARVPLLGVCFAVSESKRPDDLVCCVQRRRSGACFAWGRGGSATRVSQVRSVRAWGPSTGPTACTLVGRRCSLWGWRKGVPGGGAFHHCEGRLRSGAVPPPAARPLRGRWGPPPTCCGRGCVGVGAQHCPLGLHALWGLRAAGVVGGRPRGVACHRCEGRLASGAVPPSSACPLDRAASVLRPVCPGCGRCGCGDQAPAPQCAPLRAGVARCGGGGRASQGGVPATVVRGAWCQALSLPRPPVLWSGQPGFRDPVSRVQSVRAWGPSTSPTACALAGRRCSLLGLRKGVPGGGAFYHCEGHLRSGAVPPPTARPLGGPVGSATHVLWARVCGCGGPTLSPWPACPVGAACRGGSVGPSPGGLACHRCEGAWCQALSLPRPPVLWSGQPGFRDPCVSRAVGAGVGTQHRSHSVRPCRPALLAVGVAAGRPRGGAFNGCEGRLRSAAVPPPTARPLGGLLVSATHVLWARVCGCGGPTLFPWPACPVGAACCGGGGGPSPGAWPATVVRGACCQALYLPRPPILWNCRQGSATRVSRVPSLRAWGSSTGSRACALAGEAGSDPRGHLWVTWGVYLCAGKPPLADIILSHQPGLTRCDSVIGLAIPATSGHIQHRFIYQNIRNQQGFFIIMFP